MLSSPSMFLQGVENRSRRCVPFNLVEQRSGAAKCGSVRLGYVLPEGMKDIADSDGNPHVKRRRGPMSRSRAREAPLGS